MSPARSLYGPMFVGVFANLLLLGIICVQILLYQTNYKHDHIFVKLFVVGLLFVSILGAVFNIIPVYLSLVVHFGDEVKLQMISWAMIAEVATEVATAYMVQVFLTWRIYRLIYQKLWIIVPIFVLATCQCISGLATTVALSRVPNFERSGEIRSVFVAWFASSIATNGTISSTLVIYMSKVLSNMTDNFKLTPAQLAKVTVPTGLLMVFASVIHFILFFFASTGVRMGLSMIFPTLYVTSLMSNLNSRQIWNYAQERGRRPNRLIPDVSIDTQFLRTNRIRPPVFAFKPEIIPPGALNSTDAERGLRIAREEDSDSDRLSLSRVSIVPEEK